MSDLTMRRGDTPIWDLELADQTYDLSVVTEIYMTTKYDVADADVDAVFQLTKTGGQIVVDPVDLYKATIQPERSDTNTLTQDVALVYDVQISETGAPDTTFTVVDGTLTIQRDVTRAP